MRASRRFAHLGGHVLAMCSARASIAAAAFVK
jgi:hypothetical protein